MSGLLTEIADYDTPGSWGPASVGWPEITGDDAYDMYVFANCVQVVPYGSYVLISQAGCYGATQSLLRVHSAYISTLQMEFEAAGKPTADESISKRGNKSYAKKWW